MISDMLKPNIKRKQKTFTDVFKRLHNINERETVAWEKYFSMEKVFKYVKRGFIQVNNQ